MILQNRVRAHAPRTPRRSPCLCFGSKNCKQLQRYKTETISTHEKALKIEGKK